MDFQKCKIIFGAVKLAHTAIVLYPSTVPLQEKVDSEDSALYVCRYAYNMLAMAGQSFTKEDSEDNFARLVTGSIQFNFTPIEISQLRVEVYMLLANLERNFTPIELIVLSRLSTKLVTGSVLWTATATTWMRV